MKLPDCPRGSRGSRQGIRSGSRRGGRHGALRGKCVLREQEGLLLLSVELEDAIGGRGVEGVYGIGMTAGADERDAESGVQSARVIVRADEIESSPIGLDGVVRATDLEETVSQAGQSRSGSGIRAVDGGSAERHSGVSRVAGLQKRIAKTEVDLL